MRVRGEPCHREMKLGHWFPRPCGHSPVLQRPIATRTPPIPPPGRSHRPRDLGYAGSPYDRASGREGLRRDMAAFHDFLTQLLGQGRVAFRSAKAPDDRPAERDVTLLAESFEIHALTVAGPPIEFDARVACAAAELVRQASWALI